MAPLLATRLQELLELRIRHRRGVPIHMSDHHLVERGDTLEHRDSRGNVGLGQQALDIVRRDLQHLVGQSNHSQLGGAYLSGVCRTITCNATLWMLKLYLSSFAPFSPHRRWAWCGSILSAVIARGAEVELLEAFFTIWIVIIIALLTLLAIGVLRIRMLDK